MVERKKELGQFFTNPVIANYMAELALFPGAERVLDPAAGNGIFFDALEQKKPNSLSYTAYDIDKEMIESLKNTPYSSLQLFHQDYLSSKNEENYDIIIANPPYHRFQEIPNRDRYIADFKEHYHINLLGFSNLCVYFLVKSLHELKENGRLVYLLPYEFLNAGYGTPIKQYLLDSGMLQSIIKFDRALPLFEDAVTTSCILVMENSQNNKVDFITISSMKEINTRQYSQICSVPYSKLTSKEKWNYLFFKSKEHYRNLVPLKQIASVKRGIATGNNAFFSLNREQVAELNLSREACIRCIGKSLDIQSSVFTDEDFQKLLGKNRKVFLFDGEKAHTKADLSYIKMGEAKDVDKGYLTGHRNPWYRLEKKEAAPIWISVFHRNRLKVIRNETDCKQLTTFHGIYFNNVSEDHINIFFCYLLSPIGQKLLYENKREYGAGLDKFEPSDLNHAMVLNPFVIEKKDQEKILDCYGKIRIDGPTKNHLVFLEKIFEKYIL